MGSRKSFATTQILLLLACLQVATTTEEMQEVKPRWIYNNNNNNNSTKSLPDFIKFDLQLQSGNISLKFVKQSKESNMQPLTISESEGQSSIWKPHEEELLGVYKDSSLDAFATVIIKNVNGNEETLYMITFSHNGNAVSLGPRMFLLNNPFTDVKEKDTADENVNKDDGRLHDKDNKDKILKIDGILHSLHESKSSKSKHNISQDEDNGSGMLNESKFMKRSTGETAIDKLITIKIFTVFDHTIIKMYSRLSKATSEDDRIEDAKKTTRYIFTHIMEGVKNILEGIKIKGFKFTTKWVGGYFASKSSDSSYIERSLSENGTLSGFQVIRKLSEWASKRHLPNQALLAAFTSLDMTFDDLRTPLYGAARGSICTSSNLAIIQHDRFHNTIRVTAHELGHVLGMNHDGEGNECKAEDDYIMAPSTGEYYEDDQRNYFLYSNCSLRNLYSTIKNIFDEDHATYIYGNPYQKANLRLTCLMNGNEDFNSGREKDILLRLYPGQIFDLDDQCKLAFGKTSLHIGGFENGHKLCRKIKCTNSTLFMMTMDGTTCSSGAWCRMGNCVPDGRARRAPEHCVNGDNVIPHQNKLCEDEINEDPKRCEMKSTKNRCCASCSGKRKRNRGCQDTIGECSKLAPRDCYSRYYATTCCKTCRALVKNPSNANCLYGDKGVNCSKLAPEVCQLSTQYCCQTCAAKATPTNTTYSTPASPSKIIAANNASFTNSCTQGTLDYFTVWGERLSLTCNELVKRNSHLCHYDNVQKHCCTSCKNVKLVKGYCKSGDDNGELTYLHKKFKCRQLVDYNPRLCEVNATVKYKCCKSCGRFIVKPID